MRAPDKLESSTPNQQLPASLRAIRCRPRRNADATGSSYVRIRPPYSLNNPKVFLHIARKSYFSQQPCEFHATSINSRLHRSHGHLQDIRNFVIRKFFKVSQDDSLAKVRRNPNERPMHALG